MKKIKIFILEDDELKFDSISHCILSHFVDADIKHCKYFNEGISTLIEGDFDYAILDNNVPRFRDSNVHFVTDTVKEALEYIYLEEKSVKVIACSSETVKIDSTSLNYIGQVRYGKTFWKILLVDIIQNEENKKVL